MGVFTDDLKLRVRITVTYNTQNDITFITGSIQANRGKVPKFFNSLQALTLTKY